MPPCWPGCESVLEEYDPEPESEGPPLRFVLLIAVLRFVFVRILFVAGTNCIALHYHDYDSDYSDWADGYLFSP